MRALCGALLLALVMMFPASHEAHANCTAPCTKTQVTTDINTNWPDNTQQLITPALLRSTVLDLVNSYLDTNGSSSFACPTNQVLTAIATLSTYTCATIPATFGTQTANFIFAGPTSGAPANPAFRAMVANDLPTAINWFQALSTSGPTSAASQTILVGTLAGLQTLSNNGQGWFYSHASDGAVVQGQGSVDDIVFVNKSGAIVCSVATGTQTLNCNTLTLTNGLTNTNLANMNADTIKCNNTGGSTTPIDCTPGQLGNILCSPNTQYLTTGTNLTYTTPTCNGQLPTRIEFEGVGGGGGGAGSGTGPGAATAGGNTCWNTSSPACTSPTFAANGGALGGSTVGVFAAGGTTTGCDLGLVGGIGGTPTAASPATGGMGGVSFFGGAGPPGSPSGGATGGAAQNNTGSGGGGAGTAATANSGGGGGAGGYCRKTLLTPASSYFYTIAAAGTAGTAGTGGAAGAAGGTGLWIARAFWQ